MSDASLSAAGVTFAVVVTVELGGLSPVVGTRTLGTRRLSAA